MWLEGTGRPVWALVPSRATDSIKGISRPSAAHGFSQPFRQGEHHVAVRYRREQRLVQTAAPPGESLTVTAEQKYRHLHLGDHRAPVATGRGEALVPHQAELPGMPSASR